MPPSARDVLLGDREQLPAWLLEADEFRPEDFFSSRVVYYPGAGTDGQAFDLFCATHCAHCVLHIDWDTSASDVQNALALDNPHHVAGYTPCVSTLLTPADVVALLALNPELCPNVQESFVRHPSFVREPIVRSALWAVLERQSEFGEEHGPKRIAFLHIQAEAIWVCRSVWSALDRHPFAVIIQNHGFGGNWTTFGGENSPLYEFLLQPQQSLPKWLLVGDNTRPWPTYSKASDPTLPAGMGPFARSLYQQKVKNKGGNNENMGRCH